jgi:hypothetical protein
MAYSDRKQLKVKSVDLRLRSVNLVGKVLKLFPLSVRLMLQHVASANVNAPRDQEC